MCKFCVTHGEGGKWYEVARNYATKMYNYQKEGARKKRAEYIEKKMAEVKEMREEGKIIENGEGWFVDSSGEFHTLPGGAIDLDIVGAELVQEVVAATSMGAEDLPFIRKKVNSIKTKILTLYFLKIKVKFKKIEKTNEIHQCLENVRIKEKRQIIMPMT